MSASKKLIGTDSGKPETAMQKLKAVWLRLPEPTQDYWREQFSSSRKQADLRAEIAKKLSVTLPTDSKLTKFRSWLEDQDARDAQAERMEENTRRIQKQHPDWTLDQVREEVLRQSYFETLATGNFGLGLKTVRADQNERTGKFKAELEKEKLKLAQQAEARAQEEFKLAREKFEFDGAKAALAHLPKLKAIASNKSLSEADKVNATRQLLFGVLPK
jgi:phosphoglycolate phosphatase-like HAD superfamily hydrolase